MLLLSQQAGGSPLFQLLFFLATMGFFYLVWGTIAVRMGYSRRVSLLMLVPVINALFIFYIAFTKSPMQEELDELKKQKSVG